MAGVWAGTEVSRGAWWSARAKNPGIQQHLRAWQSTGPGQPMDVERLGYASQSCRSNAERRKLLSAGRALSDEPLTFEGAP